MSGRAVDGSPSGWPFWTAVVVGWGLVAFATAGLVGRLGLGGTLDVAVWVVGGNIAHDAVVAPLASAVTVLVALVVHRRFRAPLLAGLATTAVVLLVAVPLLGGFGRKPRNPSLLPLDYPIAVATVVGVVWGLVAAWCAGRWLHLRGGRVSRSTRGGRRASP